MKFALYFFLLHCISFFGTALSQLELRNFFMYIIINVIHNIEMGYFSVPYEKLVDTMPGACTYFLTTDFLSNAVL